MLIKNTLPLKRVLHAVGPRTSASTRASTRKWVLNVRYTYIHYYSHLSTHDSRPMHFSDVAARNTITKLSWQWYTVHDHCHIIALRYVTRAVAGPDTRTAFSYLPNTQLLNPFISWAFFSAATAEGKINGLIKQQTATFVCFHCEYHTLTCRIGPPSNRHQIRNVWQADGALQHRLITLMQVKPFRDYQLLRFKVS